jgi:hypothetical protein
MSDNYFSENRTTSLVYWSLGQMMKGAAWAAAFLLGVGLLLGVIYGIGLLLPEESKQAPPPMGAVTIETLIDHA